MNELNWKIIDLNGVAAQPWRNGGGRTQALLAWPGPDDWQVRCSVATVAAAGPFSSFAGVLRWFAVLEGAGVRLTIDEGVHEQTRSSEPLPFDGGANTTCALINGETRDFNLMLHGCTGQMQLISKHHTHRTHPTLTGQWLAVYSHTCESQIKTQGQTLLVPAQHLAWTLINSAQTINVSCRNALWMQANL